MNQKANLKNAQHLLQREIVLLEDAGHKIGRITEVFLHPTRGTLLGLSLCLAGNTTPVQIAVQYLLFTETPFADERAAVLTDAFLRVEDFDSGVTTMKDLLGAMIVTGEGKFGGQLQGVYFDEESLQTIYQIKRPGLRGWLGGKSFIAGSDGDFYSPRYRRLILSHGAPWFNSLAEAVTRWQHVPTAPFLPVFNEDKSSPLR